MQCLLGSQRILYLFPFFFFNYTATTEMYTLSLHDALPIFGRRQQRLDRLPRAQRTLAPIEDDRLRRPDRKSTRLNSSHVEISYAVFCLKKKNNIKAIIKAIKDNSVAKE